MITNKGRELISKYLLGQAPSYASYISFGCGADSTATPEKESMDFEMLRVPISSRSNLDIEGNSIISFAGDIPLEEQYIITEVAVWSDSRNAAAQSDSRVLFAFTSDENWQIREGTETKVIPVKEDSLSGVTPDDGVINESEKIFIADADNLTLVSGRDGQGTRFLNRTILMRGDSFPVDPTDPSTPRTRIFLDGRNIDLSSNSGDDLLKFAFAMYPKNPTWDENTTPPSVSFTIRFMSDPSLGIDDDNPPPGSAVWKGSVTTPNKFNVITTKLEDVTTSAQGFSWKGTRYVEIEFANFSADWYVGIDAIRFDNVTTPNPLYVMSGYTSVGDGDALIKAANTNAYAEFRFGLNVDG